MENLVLDANTQEEGEFLRACKTLAREITTYRWEYIAGVATLLHALFRVRAHTFLSEVLGDVRAVVEHELHREDSYR